MVGTPACSDRAPSHLPLWALAEGPCRRNEGLGRESPSWGVVVIFSTPRFPAVGVGDAWTEMEVTLNWSILGHWPPQGLESVAPVHRSLCVDERRTIVALSP